MRLGELLADPGLGLRLLVGDVEPDPEFRWIYITDLRDPRRYLGGGEVVLTGMLWYHDPRDAEAFVSAIAEMGVVALGVGTAEIGPVTFDVVMDACRRHGVRLFTVPLDVSFTSITQRVVSALAAEHVRRSSAVLEHHRRLVAALGAGGGLDGLVAAGAVELGVPCWVITPTGRVVAGATPLRTALRSPPASCRPRGCRARSGRTGCCPSAPVTGSPAGPSSSPTGPPTSTTSPSSWPR
ncbi:PucR family transcriptional regulator ligand-binding domain-containing protein [Kutzneria kofuensis]|uniref:PucR family transcriptional regulator ligand-binding domain-containing protein n=1 Tax=Kutzneria kofuensis TaxID=103725 RepID=UPI0031EF4546